MSRFRPAIERGLSRRSDETGILGTSPLRDMIALWTRIKQSPWHALEANAYFMVCGRQLRTGWGIPEGRETSKLYPEFGDVCPKCQQVYKEEQ